MTDTTAFDKLNKKLNEMQIELMQHNWPSTDRIERAAAFRNDLFQCISDYRDWWINRTTTDDESIHYDALAEAEDEAKALEEEIEEENKDYYESITNPNRI